MLKGAVCRFNVGNPDLLAFWKNAEELALFEKRREKNACWLKGRMEDFYARNPGLRDTKDKNLQARVIAEENAQWARVPWAPRFLSGSALASYELENLENLCAKIEVEERKWMLNFATPPKNQTILPLYQLRHSSYSQALRIEWQP